LPKPEYLPEERRDHVSRLPLAGIVAVPRKQAPTQVLRSKPAKQQLITIHNVVGHSRRSTRQSCFDKGLKLGRGQYASSKVCKARVEASAKSLERFNDIVAVLARCSEPA
jgi:hypothetical protein